MSLSGNPLIDDYNLENRITKLIFVKKLTKHKLMHFGFAHANPSPVVIKLYIGVVCQ